MANMISDTELAELAGEASVEDVRELNLRNRGLTSFEAYAPKLPHLLLLSLSHNQLHSLQGFSHLVLLTSLNVNFNVLGSLDGIQGCAALQHLFASNNRLRDLAPLAHCTALQTLHLFHNAISALGACLSVLQQLPRLSSLELSANPVSLVPGYKQCVVMAVPALTSLDGDQVTDLDHRGWAAEDFEAAGCAVQQLSTAAVAQER